VAATQEGQALTEEHRLDQVAIKAAFLAQFVQLWPSLSWPDLDATAPAWVRASMALIRSFRQRSARRSERYFQDFRIVEAPVRARLHPSSAVEYVHAPDIPDDLVIDVLRDVRNAERQSAEAVRPRIDWAGFDRAAERSLLVTGPGELKRQAGMGRAERQARDRGLVVASGSASRHVLNGGRETALTLIHADDTVLGWARVTDSDPCAFCALLASRGPVYRSPKRASFPAHDGCCCTAEAVYSSSASWPGRAREFQRLYYRSTKGYSGKDAINAFRRAHDKNRREAAPPEFLSA
jgi:hypothetical protein